MNRFRVFLDSFSIVSLLRNRRRLKERESLAELVDVALECPAIRPLQVRSEFLELVKLVEDQQCKYLLEIGTFMGGTLFVFSQIATADATVISLDFPTSFSGRLYRIFRKPIFHRLIRKGQSLFFLRKDSHKPETLASIHKVLQGSSLDFLFIDGDHTYEGVRLDFEMYSPLVRDGGLIAFHDIAQSGRMRKVHEFWDEVKQNYNHKEFIHITDEGAMGIGVLWV
jgi:predicted O-methyltransferase YrrM